MASTSARATISPSAPPATPSIAASDRELPPMRRAADEEQARDVRARHQQHQDDGPQQHPEHGGRPAGQLLVQRDDADRLVSAVGIGMVLAQPPANRRKVVVRLRHRDVRLQPRDHPQESLGPIGSPRIGRRRVRHDDFGVADERHEIRTQDADDRERLAVQHERLADCAGRAAESALPHAMADERRRPPLVVCLQRTAELNLRAGDLEVVRRDAQRGEPLRVPLTGEIRAPRKQRDDALQRAGGALEVLDIQQRQRVSIGSRADDREGDQAIGLDQRQGPNQDRVDEREHGGGRADGEREHGDDPSGERGLPADAAGDLPDFGHRHGSAYGLPRYNDSSLFSLR
jgi:hypothetical protein